MILVTGASGHIGRRVADLLSRAGVALRLISRRPDHVRSEHDVDVVHGDFREPHTLTAAFAGIRVALVISAQARPGERALLHRNAFRAAERACVKHVVYLSLKGASPGSLYLFCRDHYRSEGYLEDTGIAHTTLRNAFYQDMFTEKFDVGGMLRGPAGDGHGAFISREDAAQAAVAAVLTCPCGTLDMTGPEAVTVGEIARRLSLLTRRRLIFVPEPAGDMRRRLIAAAVPVWRQDLEVGWFEAIAAGEQSPASPAFRHLVGHDPETIDDYFSKCPGLLEPLLLSEPV